MLFSADVNRVEKYFSLPSLWPISLIMYLLDVSIGNGATRIERVLKECMTKGTTSVLWSAYRFPSYDSDHLFTFKSTSSRENLVLGI